MLVFFRFFSRAQKSMWGFTVDSICLEYTPQRLVELDNIYAWPSCLSWHVPRFHDLRLVSRLVLSLLSSHQKRSAYRLVVFIDLLAWCRFQVARYVDLRGFSPSHSEVSLALFEGCFE